MAGALARMLSMPHLLKAHLLVVLVEVELGLAHLVRVEHGLGPIRREGLVSTGEDIVRLLATLATRRLLRQVRM